MRVTVIGIGQTLRGDDAAGIEAVHRWQDAYPLTASRPEVAVQCSELPGLGLLDMLEGFDAALIIDAVQTAAAPGTILWLSPGDLESFTRGSKSAHGWGIAETLQLARQVDPSRLPPHVRLLGIVAQHMDIGEYLSAPLQEALPAISEAIEAEVQRMLIGSSSWTETPR